MKTKAKTQVRAITPDSKMKCLPTVATILLLLAAGGLLPAFAQAQPPGSSSAGVTYYATYKLSGGTATESDQAYAASAIDTSAIWVTDSGKLTLVNPTITTTGNTSSADNSSKYGLNAGVLTSPAGVVTITGGSVTTSGSGANGLFATGAGSAITMSDGTITTTGSAAHGVDVTYGGAITLTNVAISTQGDGASAGLSTDFGGGTVTVAGGSVTTAGTKSPAIYSTGVITVSGAKLTATGGDGAVIDGANTIALKDTSLLGKKCGVKVHRTAPSSGSATVAIDGGSLTATAGEAFLFVAESGSLAAAVIVKGGATISTSTGCLVNATSASTVTLTADGETLAGSLIADNTSSIAATLKNGTTLTSAITKAALTVDSTSTWVVQGASTLAKLTTAGTISFGSLANTVTVTGAASLGGKLLLNLGTTVPSAGTYPLVSAGTVSGAFSSLAFSQTLPPGVTATLDYSGTAVTLTVAQTSPTIAGRKDATGADALFNQPKALAFDSSDNLYVADTSNAAIRTITPAGVVTTVSLSPSNPSR